VQEYTIRFICMMQYAPKETSSNKKKIALSGHECRTLRQMINKVLEMEGDRLEADAQRERKEKRHQGEGSSRTLAQGAALSRGGGFYSANSHRPAQGRPTQSLSQSTWKAPASTATGSVPFTCFTCGQPSHKLVVYP
jgi:hypothetical protein